MPSDGRNDRLLGRLTLGDVLLAVVLAAVSLSLWNAGHSVRVPGASRAVLVAGGVAARTVPLDRDGLYQLSGPLGESTVEVAAGRVRMRSSPCPQQTCVRLGFRSRAGQVILCVPNRVGVLLGGEEEGLDAVTR